MAIGHCRHALADGTKGKPAFYPLAKANGNDMNTLALWLFFIAVTL